MVDLCRRIHSNVQQLRATLQEEAPGKLDEATGRNLTTALMQIVFERQFQYDFGGLM